MLGDFLLRCVVESHVFLEVSCGATNVFPSRRMCLRPLLLECAGLSAQTIFLEHLQMLIGDPDERGLAFCDEVLGYSIRPLRMVLQGKLRPTSDLRRRVGPVILAYP
jgi:hypothetical protein